jgi:hypothetical protein
MSDQLEGTFNRIIGDILTSIRGNLEQNYWEYLACHNQLEGTWSAIIGNTWHVFSIREYMEQNYWGYLACLIN